MNWYFMFLLELEKARPATYGIVAVWFQYFTPIRTSTTRTLLNQHSIQVNPFNIKCQYISTPINP